MDKEELLGKITERGWKYSEDKWCIKFESGNRTVEYDWKDVRMYIKETSSIYPRPAYVPINDLKLMLKYFL